MFTAEQVRMQLMGRVGRYPTQAAAAKAIGVSRQLLNMVLLGKRAPTLKMLDALHLGTPEVMYPSRPRRSSAGV